MKIYEYIVRMKDQASDKLNRLANGFNQASSKSDRLAGSTNRLGSRLNQLGGNAANANTGFNQLNAQWSNSLSLGTMLTRVIGPAALGAALLFGATKASALSRELEQTNITFEVMMGSAKKAQSLIGEVTSLANVTPFTRNELLDSSKMMLNFGIAEAKILPNLKMLGDISGGNANKLHLMTLAFSQSAAAGRLMGQDLLQMINAGFNPLQTISEKTGLSMAVLKKKMEDGAISTKMVEAAFRDATSEGGRFFGMMDKQSQTIEGKMSTLSDKLIIIFTQVGENLNRQWSPLLDKIIKIIDKGDIGSSISAYNSQKGKQSELSTLLGAYKESKGTPLAAEYEKKILESFPELGTDFSSGASQKLSETKAENKLAALSKGRDNAYWDTSVTFNSILVKQKQIEKLQDELNTGRADEASPFEKMFGMDKLSDADINNRIEDIGKLGNEIKETQEEYQKFKDKPDAKNMLLMAMRGGVKSGAYDPLLNVDPTKSKKLKNGIDSITGGGKQNVNVTINLQSLVAEQNFNTTTVKEAVPEMERVVIEALTRVINSANYAAAQ